MNTKKVLLPLLLSVSVLQFATAQNEPGGRPPRQQGQGQGRNRDAGGGGGRHDMPENKTPTSPNPGQTVGLFLNTSKACPGYTLFAPKHNTVTYLMDNEGRSVHQWKSEYEPGQTVYLLPNGHVAVRQQIDGLARLILTLPLVDRAALIVHEVRDGVMLRREKCVAGARLRRVEKQSDGLTWIRRGRRLVLRHIVSASTATGVAVPALALALLTGRTSAGFVLCRSELQHTYTQQQGQQYFLCVHVFSPIDWVFVDDHWVGPSDCCHQNASKPPTTQQWRACGP